MSALVESKLSIIFSNSFKKLKDKWQFAKKIHNPYFEASYTLSRAFLAWPCPRLTGVSYLSFDLAS